MTRTSFAKGYYDFDQTSFDEGIIVKFRDKRYKEFFLNRDDGSEELIISSYPIEAREGHRIRICMHETTEVLGYRVFETRSYFFSDYYLEQTIRLKDLPPHGRNIYRYSLIAFFVLSPLIIFLLPEVESMNVNGLPLLTVILLYFGNFLAIVGIISFLFVKLFIQGGVRTRFLKAVKEELKNRLYNYGTQLDQSDI